MNHRNFTNGKMANLCLYFFGMMIAIIYGNTRAEVQFIPHLVCSVVLIIIFILLFIINPGKRISTRAYMRIMCIALLFIADELGYVFRSIDVVLYVFLLQTFLVFIFLDDHIFRFQFVIMIIDTVFMSVIGYLGYGFDHLQTHNVFGLACLLLLQWLCIAIIHLFSDQNRHMQEQEQSLDDMLRLLSIKCEEYQSEVKGKTDFLSNMSHEIRTPVNSILGMNEMILRESKDERIKEYADNVYNSGRVLLSLINDILDFSKIQSGKMEIIPTIYNAFSFLQDIVSVTSEQAKEKKLILNLDIDENIPAQLYGDDVRIRQVLVNLLTNAVKYTNKGSVTLKMSCTRINEYKISLHCEVKDTGIGIKDEDLPQLFAAYERLEERKNRNIVGTGLGLAITSQILEMMESRLCVDSEYGVGSCFYFDLVQDIVEDEPIGDIRNKFTKSTSEHSYHVSLYAPKAKILVVDDNEINRKVFCNLLKQTAIQISQTDSGRKCLEMVKKEHFDMIFLDHMMPGMDGIETLHCIREEENLCKDIPIVVLTANAIAGARNNYIKEGFDDYLAKPISPNRLERMIKEMLPEELLQDILGEKEELPDTPENPPNVMSFQLPEVEGIFWGYAMSHFPDVEMLLSSLEDFYKLIPSMADKLEDMLAHIHEEGVLESYQITVHGMKSSAALIGAMELSGCARTLEVAAMQSLWQLIEVLTPFFLKNWRSYEEKLKPLVKAGDEDSSKPKEKDDQVVLELLDSIRSATETMDLDGMDNGVGELEKYELPPDCETLFKDLQVAVTDLDTEKINELADRLITAVKKG